MAVPRRALRGASLGRRPGRGLVARRLDGRGHGARGARAARARCRELERGRDRAARDRRGARALPAEARADLRHDAAARDRAVRERAARAIRSHALARSRADPVEQSPGELGVRPGGGMGLCRFRRRRELLHAPRGRARGGLRSRDSHRVGGATGRPARGLVLWAASAVVPMPLETLARPFRFLVDLRVDPLTGNIQELRPWSWSHDRADPFTALLLLWVLSLLLGGRRMWKASPALTLLALGGLALGFLGVRFRGLASWLALAPLAVALAPRGPRPARWALAVPALAAGVAGVMWLVTAPQFAFGIRPQLYSVPVRAAALAESLHLEGPMLNTFHHGGYLLWARGEKNPPLIDGRGRGSYEFRSLYARAQGDPVALDSLLEIWDFNYILIEPPQSNDDRLPINIARHLEYGLIFYDDSGLLYVRWNRYPQMDPGRLYRYLTPDYLAMTDLSERAVADTGLARLLAADLQRARAQSPLHSRASMWLGLLALGRKDGPDAVRYLDEAAEIAPATPGLALRQGFAHAMIDDAPGAIRAFRRALRDPEDREMARAELESLKPGR